MNTQENNKMIAEFMGLIIRDKEGNLPTCSLQHKLFVREEWDKLYLASPYSPNGPDYHKEWNWLMPVVEKCLIGEAEHSEDVSNLAIKNIYEGICNQDISLAYESVVKFINQLNK